MKHFKTPLCLGLLLAATLTTAAAQDSKIAFINIQRITAESAPAKMATAKLEQDFSKKQKEVNEFQNSYKTLGEKFEREAPTLSESQRMTRQKELNDMGRDLQRKKRDFEEELNSRRNDELQQVFAKATKAIQQLAETEKFDVVLQEAVYINPKIDITNKVIAILNAGSK